MRDCRSARRTRRRAAAAAEEDPSDSGHESESPTPVGVGAGCTHLGQKESPADLTIATSSNSEIEGGVPVLRRNAKSVSGTRRASTKGPRADVGGRREGAYRHCVHGMLPIRHDFLHGRGAN